FLQQVFSKTFDFDPLSPYHAGTVVYKGQVLHKPALIAIAQYLRQEWFRRKWHYLFGHPDQYFALCAFLSVPHDPLNTSVLLKFAERMDGVLGDSPLRMILVYWTLSLDIALHLVGRRQS